MAELEFNCLTEAYAEIIRLREERLNLLKYLSQTYDENEKLFESLRNIAEAVNQECYKYNIRNVEALQDD